ncbi:MAG: hypothetical protein JXB00_03635 [Bacteroidales bacterium]|nr:hypothetical protein [Bacteroidales bacterium]
MDDLFEIIIYLVILVIGGIASAARNKNKRKTISGPVRQPNVMPDFEDTPQKEHNPLEEFLKRFEDVNSPQEEPEEDYQFEVPDEPEIISEESSEVLEDYRPETTTLESTVSSPEEEGDSGFLKKDDLHKQAYYTYDNAISSSEITDAIADEDMKYENVYNIAEDIKLGIIYSEILKRKQF